LKYDVVVIGGSTAGLFTAEILAKAGKHVGVFEAMETIDPGRRTYIITPEIYRVMPDIDANLIINTTEVFSLQAGAAKATLQLSTPDLIIERRMLTLSMLRRAKEAGVEVHLGARFERFFQKQGNTHIQIRVGESDLLVQADHLIGADGIENLVGKAAGLPEPEIVPLLQTEVDLPPDWDPRLTKTWFEVSQTPYFYWLIPERQNKAVIGLIAEKGLDIRNLLYRFLEREGIQPGPYQSGLVALHKPRMMNEITIGDIRVLRVGDAAGQVKVTTVGGTVTGLKGAQCAALAILRGIPYQRALRSLNRELNIHYFIRHLLGRMNQADYMNLIELLIPPVRTYLANHHRDQMAFRFWSLPFLQPRFIPLGGKLLLKRKNPRVSKW
jgi:flavin-dependent dehydrogenase